MTTCPCKGCEPPQRAIGCHGTREHYVAWQRECSTLKAEEIKIKTNIDARYEYMKRAFKNMKKKKR